MTINEGDIVVDRNAGNDSAESWPVTFPFLEPENIVAYLLEADGTQTLLVQDTDYSISGTWEADDAAIAFPIAGSAYSTLATGDTLVVKHVPAVEQPLPLPSNITSLDLALVETSLDRMTMLIGRAFEILDRCVAYQESTDPSDVVSADEFLDDVNDAVVAAQAAKTAAELAQALSEAAQAAAVVAQGLAEDARDAAIAAAALANVTFETLNAVGDVGTGAAQLAVGNHNHSGVYEPANAAIVKSDTTAALDVGYTAGTTTAQSVGGAAFQPSLGSGNVQVFTLTENATMTAPSGYGTAVILVDRTASAYTLALAGYDDVTGSVGDRYVLITSVTTASRSAAFVANVG